MTTLAELETKLAQAQQAYMDLNIRLSPEIRRLNQLKLEYDRAARLVRDKKRTESLQKISPENTLLSCLLTGVGNAKAYEWCSVSGARLSLPPMEVSEVCPLRYDGPDYNAWQLKVKTWFEVKTGLPMPPSFAIKDGLLTVKSYDFKFLKTLIDQGWILGEALWAHYIISGQHRDLRLDQIFLPKA